MAENAKIGGTRKAQRTRRGPVSVGAALKRDVAKLSSARGFAEPDVLLRWPEIAGAHVAALCRPLSVRYGRDKGLGAALVVAAPGARAPEIEHMAPMILERVNQFYGYRAVTRLRIEQDAPGSAPQGFGEGQAPYAAPLAAAPPEPGAEQTARAEALTDRIQDPELRAALTRLGAWVMTRGETRRDGAEPDRREP